MIFHVRRPKYFINAKWKKLSVVAIAVFLFSFYIGSNAGTDEIKYAQISLPVIILLVLAAAVAIFIPIRNRYINDRHEAQAPKPDPIKEVNAASESSIRTKKISQSATSSGIGTGVFKIFQQIKDSLGNISTLTEGYRHLLNLACEHLGFSAGVVFIIDEDGGLRLRGFAGLRPDSQKLYTLEGKGIIAELFNSDIPRFNTNPKSIPGSYFDLFDGFKAAWLLPLMPQGQPAGVIIFFHDEIPEQFENFIPRLDFVSIAASWFYENHTNQIIINRENRKNKMLVETSLAISSSLDLDEVCNILVTNLSRAYGCSYSYILLESDQQPVMFVRKCFSERGEPVFRPDERFININTMILLNEIVNQGTPVLLDKTDLKMIPLEIKESLKIDNCTNVLIAPLKHAGKYTGILVMVEQRSGNRTSMDREVVDLIAALVAQASSAIENARMYSLISDRVAHLATMFEVGQALNSDLDLIPFINRVLSAISNHFKLSNCAFLMPKIESGELYVASIIGDYPEELVGRSIKIGEEGITGHAAALKMPLNIGDVSKDTRFITTTGQTGSELAVPVLLNDEVVGVLDVESEALYAFSQREEQLLKSLMDQVAAAIEKLKLKQKERERATKLAITNTLVKRLSGILNRSELLSEAVKGISEGFGFDLVAVFVPGKEDNLELAQQSCRSGYGYEVGSYSKEDYDLLARVAQSRKGYCFDCDIKGKVESGGESIKSRCCMPLIAGQNFHGILDIQDKNPRVFSEINKSTLQTITEFLAITMNNISLYVDTIDKAERLSLAGEISQAISATLDLNEFFTRISKTLSETTGYHWVTLIFKEDVGYRTSSEYFHQNYDYLMELPEIETMSKYFNEVAVHGKPVYYDIDRMSLTDSVRKYFRGQSINYLAISPIKQTKAPDCFLLVGNPNPEGFRPRDQYLLHDISRHLMIALNNAMLYSELKKAYNRLAETQEKLIQGEKLKALGELAAGIVHDFKNILAAIVGRAQILSLACEQTAGISPDTIKKSMEIIEKSATEGVNILSRINEFTKSQHELNFTTINLKAIIEDTVEIIRPKWDSPESGKEISIKMNLGDNLAIKGNRSMIIEVFSNLILNAVDAIETRGVIEIEGEYEENYLSIIVKDNGKGISPQVIKRIFDPFFTTKERLGTGLGLTMVYSIVSRHGGEIKVDSEEGRGTSFKIQFPKYTLEENVQPLNILVVEDDHNLRNVLFEIFTNRNARVMMASNYGEASGILADHSFDMILTDLGLPDGDGWGIIDSVKSKSPDCTIVPMTGWKKEIERKELTARGITQVLQKPFTIEQVVELINNLEKRIVGASCRA